MVENLGVLQLDGRYQGARKLTKIYVSLEGASKLCYVKERDPAGNGAHAIPNTEHKIANNQR